MAVASAGSHPATPTSRCCRQAARAADRARPAALARSERAGISSAWRRQSWPAARVTSAGQRLLHHLARLVDVGIHDVVGRDEADHQEPGNALPVQRLAWVRSQRTASPAV